MGFSGCRFGSKRSPQLSAFLPVEQRPPNRCSARLPPCRRSPLVGRHKQQPFPIRFSTTPYYRISPDRRAVRTHRLDSEPDATPSAVPSSHHLAPHEDGRWGAISALISESNVAITATTLLQLYGQAVRCNNARGVQPCSFRCINYKREEMRSSVGIRQQFQQRFITMLLSLE